MTVFDIQLSDHHSCFYSFISTQETSCVRMIVALHWFRTKLCVQVTSGPYLASKLDLARFWWCGFRPIWTDSQLQLSALGPDLAPVIRPLYFSWYWHIIHHNFGSSPTTWCVRFRLLKGPSHFGDKGTLIVQLSDLRTVKMCANCA